MTRSAIAAVAVLVLLLPTGCRQTPEPAGNTAASHDTEQVPAADGATPRAQTGSGQTLPMEAGPACPASGFPAFFDAYVEHLALQKAFTRWPLDATTIDSDAQPEPAPVTRSIEQTQASFPLLMTRQRAAADGLTVTVQQPDDRHAIVTYAKPDTDYQLRYWFERTGDCWMLVRMQDDSL